jgi:REP-associated tyrosine transposase
LIDHERLMNLLDIMNTDQLSTTHRKWVEEVLRNGSNSREEKWSKSIAIGSKEFLEETKDKLGARAKGRKIVNNENSNMLMEEQHPYSSVFTSKKRDLSPENRYFWSFL